MCANPEMDALTERFHGVYAQTVPDGSFGTDIPKEEIFSNTLH